MMKPLLALTLAFSLLTLATQAHAISKLPTKKKGPQTRVTVETYPATEGDSAATETLVPGTRAVGFDPVPTDQVSPLLKRLKLVETIIQKHARAFDYRKLTSKELEAILKALDTTAAQAQKSAEQPKEQDSDSGEAVL